MMNHPSLAAVLVNGRRHRLETDERHAARLATAVIVDLTVRLVSRRRFEHAASGGSSAVTA